MMRRTEMGVTIALVVLGALAGLAIAGLPDRGGGPNPIRVITNGGDAPDGDDEGDDEAAGGDDTTTTTVAETTTTTTEPPPETEPPPPVLRPIEDVVVLVANGTPVVGAAGRVTEQLAAEGHPTRTPTSTGARDVTEIWHVDAYGPDAAAVAERLGVPPEQVMAMPPEPPLDPGDAHVVVIIGPELAEPATAFP
jgi:hypothetical protein